MQNPSIPAALLQEKITVVGCWIQDMAPKLFWCSLQKQKQKKSP